MSKYHLLSGSCRALLLPFLSMVLVILAGCSDNPAQSIQEEELSPEGPPVKAQFQSQELVFHPGEIQPVLLENATVTGAVPATVGDVKEVVLYLHPDHSNMLLFVVPDGSAGEMELQFELGGTDLALPFSIAGHVPIEEPYDFIRDHVETVTGRISALLESLVEDDASALDRFRPLYDDLASTLDALAGLPEAELRIIANVMNTYLVDGADTGIAGKSFLVSQGSCGSMDALEGGIKTVAANTSYIGTILTGIGNQFMKLVGLLKHFQALSNLIDQIGSAIDNCYAVELNVETGQNKRQTDVAETAPLVFDHDEPETLAFHLNATFESVLVSLLGTIRTAFAGIREYLPESWVALLYDTNLDGFLLPFEDTLEVTNISVASVEYSLKVLSAGAGDEVQQVQFVFQFPEDRFTDSTIEYELTVGNSQAEHVLVMELYPPLPEILETHHSTIENQSLTDTLKGTYQAVFDLIIPPENGSFDFHDYSLGWFTYTPSDGFTGEDSFVVVAENAKGQSDHTTITVTVEQDCSITDSAGNMYCTVTNPVTGRTWLDRNLGASRAAVSSTDAQAYGDLYQWGRDADGHQLRNSATTTTLSSSDQPGHGELIYPRFSPYDWRSPQNNNLWQGVDGINNPCPDGYRIPTIAEWYDEQGSWISNNASGAFASPLKLPVAGSRFAGALFGVDYYGRYWSSSLLGSDARYLYFYSSGILIGDVERYYANSVRCIKD